MRAIARLGFLVWVVLLSDRALAGGVAVLVNQVGYEAGSPVHAVVLGHAGDSVGDFRLVDSESGKAVVSGKAVAVGAVDHWKDWVFWTIDVASPPGPGVYSIEVTDGDGTVRSSPFSIQRDLLERNTLSNVIYYFKGQRCSGLMDKADRHLQFEGLPGETVDAHGGWYDATGDYGKHLSHLSFSNYFNPQQIPFTDWVLLRSHEELHRRNTLPANNFRQYQRRLLDEGMFGADYLVRVKDPAGSFYRSVDEPGGEKRPEDRFIATERRSYIIKTDPVADAKPTTPAAEEALKTFPKLPYEVGYRGGGGLAIAALARASRGPGCGEFGNAQYLQAARDAFAFLEAHNLIFAKDGKENIIDDYAALMAACELDEAAPAAEFKAAADRRGKSLMDRLVSSGKYRDYWRADDGDRPFFHPADAGMPVVALLDYYDIADEGMRGKVLDVVKRSLEFELRTTGEVANPFGYARQLVQSPDGGRRTAFFFPHDTEAAPWWQGENARLASLAAAARMAVPYFAGDVAFQQRLKCYAWNQLNWILGLNPYNACMLHGSGQNNISYMFFDSYEYTSAPGGICNGITGGISDSHDIDFNLGFAVTKRDDDWRWGEQWLPHASWYLLAVSFDH